MTRKRLLIVAATHKEIEPLTGKTNDNFFALTSDTDVLITGVGVMPTTYYLTETLSANEYSLVLNAGIAGSMTNKFGIGETVEIISDTLVTAGKFTKTKYKSMFEAGLWNENEPPFLSGIIINRKHFNNLPGAKAITTSIIGFDKSPFSKYRPEVETMEGAAFFYTCHKKNCDCAAVRTISNFVKDNKWEIETAVKNLCDFIANNFEL